MIGFEYKSRHTSFKYVLSVKIRQQTILSIELKVFTPALSSITVWCSIGDITIYITIPCGALKNEIELQNFLKRENIRDKVM